MRLSKRLHNGILPFLAVNCRSARLTVTDYGQGIPGGVESARFVAQGYFEMASMRERAAMIGGRLDVQTGVDYGTVVIFEIPTWYSGNP